MATLEEQLTQRRSNLDELTKLGVDSYPRRFDRTHSISQLVASYGQRSREELEADRIETTTSGRILGIRSFGKASFLVLSDGVRTIQAYVRQDSVPELDFKVFKLLDFGDVIGVEGWLFRTKTNEFSIHASRVHFLVKCLVPLPEKWHGLTDIEIRYRQRYRDFMTHRGYLEVETPMMQPIAGGALARPFTTHHNTLDMPLYLRIAPELYLKRLTVGGIEKVFEINRNFRNEGIGWRWNPEFTMLEFYQAYTNYRGVMDLTQQLIEQAALDVNGTTKSKWGNDEIDWANANWRRLTMREAIIHYWPEAAGAKPAMSDFASQDSVKALV